MLDSYSAGIVNLYREYIRWSQELMGSFGGVRMFAQLFTGGGEYKNRPEHMTFFNAVEKAAEEYAVSLAEGNIERDSLPRLLKYVLLDCHAESDDWSDWMLLAAEKHFISLVEGLTAEEAASLYEPYRKLRRRSKGLPPQDDILRLLKKAR